jgi:hypothetical protein
MAGDEKMQPNKVEETEDDEETGTKWKAGDRVFAMWAGNGSFYPATVNEADNDQRIMKVTWDDLDDSYRVISYDQVMDRTDETTAWSTTRIDKKASIKASADKGRCLFTNEGCEPGHVVFVERPTLVALPASNPKLWEHLTKLHEAQPLNLGTVTFHYAALLSQLELDEQQINVILDKFVPDPDEDPSEDVIRIIASLQESLAEVLKLKEHPLDPKRLQRLVSAWRYNSFGHHKEDGLVLYNRISMCAHSCDPTCCWSYGEEDAFVLRARIGLKKNDELTISYLQDEDLLKSTAVRQQKLQNWRFTCMCGRCKEKVDTGRGFKCRRCRVGILNASAGSRLEPCTVCTAPPTSEDATMLLSLEEEYVNRVENLDKTDVADVETVYQASIEIFEKHWILYVMDTILWDANREKHPQDAVEHQRRRIEFHEHYYNRPTFILAWCHEELGDSLQVQFPNRRWHYVQEFTRAYQMLMILCGSNHQYTTGPYQKMWQAHNQGQQVQTPRTPGANNSTAGATAGDNSTPADLNNSTTEVVSSSADNKAAKASA